LVLGGNADVFRGSKPTVKQKLAAVRMLYDFSGRSANYTIEAGTFRSRSMG